MRNSQYMLDLIRNNFSKGCLVRFLAYLATKIEKRQQQILPEICQDQKRGKTFLRSSNHPRKNYSNKQLPHLGSTRF
jgi:hypothetical protein